MKRYFIYPRTPSGRVLPWHVVLRLSVVFLFGRDCIMLLVDNATVLNFVYWLSGLCLMSQFYFEACDKPPPPVRRHAAGLAWVRSS